MRQKILLAFLAATALVASPRIIAQTLTLTPVEKPKSAFHVRLDSPELREVLGEGQLFVDGIMADGGKVEHLRSGVRSDAGLCELDCYPLANGGQICFILVGCPGTNGGPTTLSVPLVIEVQNTPNGEVPTIELKTFGAPRSLGMVRVDPTQ